MSKTGKLREDRKHILKFGDLGHKDVTIVKEAIAMSGASDSEFLIMSAIKFLKGDWTIHNIEDVDDGILQTPEDTIL